MLVAAVNVANAVVWLVILDGPFRFVVAGCWAVSALGFGLSAALKLASPATPPTDTP